MKEEIIIRQESTERFIAEGYKVDKCYPRIFIWYELGEVHFAIRNVTLWWKKFKFKAHVIDDVIKILEKIKKEHDTEMKIINKEHV